MSEFFRGVQNTYAKADAIVNLNIPEIIANYESTTTTIAPTKKSRFIASSGVPSSDDGSYESSYLDIGKGEIYQKTISYLQPVLRKIVEPTALVEVNNSAGLVDLNPRTTYILTENIILTSSLFINGDEVKIRSTTGKKYKISGSINTLIEISGNNCVLENLILENSLKLNDTQVVNLINSNSNIIKNCDIITYTKGIESANKQIQITDCNFSHYEKNIPQVGVDNDGSKFFVPILLNATTEITIIQNNVFDINKNMLHCIQVSSDSDSIVPFKNGFISICNNTTQSLNNYKSTSRFFYSDFEYFNNTQFFFMNNTALCSNGFIVFNTK
jgi:hypothetical protein